VREPGLIAAGLAATGIPAVAGIASANSATGLRIGAVAATETSAPTTICQAGAERIALARVPGTTVIESRLDTDNRHTVWNVHLSTVDAHIEVRVDAEAGEIRADDAVDDGSGVDDHGQPGSDDGADDHTNGQYGHGDDDPTGHE
jgi:hypothetical protein